MLLDLIMRIPRLEDVCKGIQTLCTALGGRALQICDLLDAGLQFGAPGVGGEVVGVKDVVDGVRAIPSGQPSILPMHLPAPTILWQREEVEVGGNYDIISK